MTGDQGAVLLCVQRNMNAFVPPRPCPRLCSGCTASGDRRSRCSAFVRAEEHERFCPPPPLPRLLLEMTGDQGAVLLCVQTNMNAFVPPPAPAQDYVQGAHGHITSDEGAVQGAMLQGCLTG